MMTLTRRHSLTLLLALLLATLLAPSCQRHQRSADATADQKALNDSAYKMYVQINEYSIRTVSDTVKLLTPPALDFCARHGLWRYYYNIWYVYAEDLIWQLDYDNAIREGLKMQQDAIGRNDQYGQAMAYLLMGTAYFSQSNQEEASQCFRQAVDIYPDYGSEGKLIYIYGYYCSTLEALGRYEALDSVLQRWSQLLDRFPVVESLPDADVRANWHYKYQRRLFAYQLGMKHYREAAVAIDSAAYYEKIDGDYAINLVNILNDRFNLAMAEGRYEEALGYGQQLHGMAQNLTLDAQVIGYQTMSRAQEELGHYKEALANLKQYNLLSDSLKQVENREQLNAMNKRFEVNELKAAQEHQQLAHERTRLLLLLVIAVLAAVAVGIYIILRLRAARRLAIVSAQKERIESELRIARDIQMSMVSGEFPQREGLDLCATMMPAREVGGDLYDFLLQDDRLYFCVGDVSGKGVPASLFMAQTLRLFRALAKRGQQPAEIVTSLNDELTENNAGGMFVTMFIGLADLTTGRLDFCNAGHNPPVVGGSTDGGQFLEMEANAPIGLWPQLAFVEEHLDSIKGRPFFLYTDGLNEAENARQEQFGDDRLLSILRQTRYDSARQVIDTLVEEVEKHRQDAEPNDDLTMLCLRIN